MKPLEIDVDKYYLKEDYYRFMPEALFNALEAAFLEGKKTAAVSKDDFDMMMKGYKDEVKTSNTD
jgi:hypothetical protein